MVRPDLNIWGQTPADLRGLSVHAQHRRSRSRFLALYMMTTQQTSATTWTAQIGHTKNTVPVKVRGRPSVGRIVTT